MRSSTKYIKSNKMRFFFYFMSSHFYKPQQFSQTTFISRNIIALLIYHIHLISKRQHITYWYLPSYTQGFSFFWWVNFHVISKIWSRYQILFCINNSTWIKMIGRKTSPMSKIIKVRLWLIISPYFEFKTWSIFLKEIPSKMWFLRIE